MGFMHHAYIAYSVHVPADQFRTSYREIIRLEGVVKSTPALTGKVGYFEAGGYDRNMLFLTASNTFKSVALGSFVVAGRAEFLAKDVWDTDLAAFIAAAGYTGLAEPGWLFVPDMS